MFTGLKALLEQEGDPIDLTAPERERAFALAELVLEKESGGLAGLSIYFRRISRPSDVPRLRVILRRVEERQLREEIASLVDRLSESQEEKEGKADAI